MTEEEGILPFPHINCSNAQILPIVESSSPTHPIDVEAIRQNTKRGLDANPKIDRSLSWLILLKIYPQDKTKWPSVFHELKDQYFDYVNFTNLQDWHKNQISPQITIDDFGEEMHDMGIIHGDVVRSGRLFFFLPCHPILYPQKVAEQGDVLFEFQAHLRRLERLLYVFRTLHKGLGYMQGFNELAIPFYYVMLQPYRKSNQPSSTKASSENNEDIHTYNDEGITENILDIVEALTFHCFQKIMTETALSELYTTQDDSSIIKHHLKKFEMLMKKHLPKCADAIQSLNIHPIFYCLRWFILCFAQEHDFPSLLIIWDSLLAHYKTFVDYLFYAGLGHIKMVENKIELKQYSATIEALQHLHVSGKVKDILDYANQKWEEDKQGSK